MAAQHCDSPAYLGGGGGLLTELRNRVTSGRVHMVHIRKSVRVRDSIILLVQPFGLTCESSNSLRQTG